MFDFHGGEFVIGKSCVNCVCPSVFYFACGVRAFLDYSLTS